MSHSRKHLKTSALSSFPVPNEIDRVAQVTELRGSNVCQIRFPDSSVTLCQIPNKFRKLIWIKKGRGLTTSINQGRKLCYCARTKNSGF